MNKEDVIQKLVNQYPTAAVLRSKNPELSDLLTGEFADGYTPYEFKEGIVVSRRLLQGKEKDPTVGIITPGKYEFNTGGNTETMTVLEGYLVAGVNDLKKSTLQKYGSIIAPSGTTLKFETLQYTFYFCQYFPKK